MTVARLGLKLKVKVKGQCPARVGVVTQKRGRSDIDPRPRTVFLVT